MFLNQERRKQVPQLSYKVRNRIAIKMRAMRWFEFKSSESHCLGPYSLLLTHNSEGTISETVHPLDRDKCMLTANSHQGQNNRMRKTFLFSRFSMKPSLHTDRLLVSHFLMLNAPSLKVREHSCLVL
jgi:hypothetical protein